VVGARADRAEDRVKMIVDERRGITDVRSVVELDAALVAAQAGAGRAYERTNGCRDVDRGVLIPCRRVLDLRAARARAEQRDRLDLELTGLDHDLTTAPTINNPAPGPLWLRPRERGSPALCCIRPWPMLSPCVCSC
jgi:hypothetical protein